MTSARNCGVPPAPGAYARTEHPERVHQAIRRERLAPSWLLASLVLATLGALLILFPKTYIEANLRTNPAPNATTLARISHRVLPTIGGLTLAMRRGRIGCVGVGT